MATQPVMDAGQPDQQMDETTRAAVLDAARGIIGRLSKLAQEHVTAKAPIELRWLEDLRAYHGRHDEQTESVLAADKTGRSKAFIKLTQARTNAWEARLSDMLFPVDDWNWGINPTPVPQLTQSAREAVALAKKAADQANAAMKDGAPPEQVQAIVDVGNAAADQHRQIDDDTEEAKKRCAAMEREMRDQLVECNYPARCRDVIGHAVKLGVGILKGPISGNRVAKSWYKDERGVYVLDQASAHRPEFRVVDPWAFFPDMSATRMDEAEFTFERHLPSRKELRQMAKKLGFDKDAVKRLIEGGAPQGADHNLNHLTQLRAITDEGQAITGRYVMWEYHGPLETQEVANLLRAGGRDQDAAQLEQDADPYEDHMVIMFFCNNELLDLREAYPLDSGESLYSVFSFERGEASIMGAIGVPRKMMNSQRAMNGAWRMTLDNAALAVGPQIVVDDRVIEPEDGNWTITPNKVWRKTGQELAPNQKAFEVFSIPINQQELSAIIEIARAFADEETSMPLIAQGDQGSHITQTQGGMAMLFNSANVVFRRVVKNWDDDLTAPSIRRLYDWNMQFNEDEDVKGDMSVQARGTSVLIVKEMQAQNLMLIAQNWTVHPVLSLMMKDKGYHAARMALQSMNVPPDEIFESMDEFKAVLKQQEENASQQQSPEMIVAQSRIDAANISAKSREASDQVALQIAQQNHETEMMRLAEQRNMTIDQLQGMLSKTKMVNDSAERKLAVEVAVETQNKREAEARGLEPTGSGGDISMGQQKAARP